MVDDLHHLLHHIRIFCCHVGIFVYIDREVVELGRTILDHQLPVAHTQRHHIGFMEFPVQEFVLFLCSIITTERIVERHAVPALSGCARLATVSIAIESCIVEERRHQVVEGQLVIVHCTCRHTGTFGNEGHADTAFVCRALCATQQAIAVEPCGICTTFFVRSVVRGEDHEGIVSESLFFEFLEDFTYLSIETSDHSCELRMTVGVFVIP